MKIIGLTGGIGSGKTTIANMFKNLGIPVYFADDEAKKLMTNSESIRKKIINNFGTEAYINGKLNRKYLADNVFNNKANLSIINKIVHPEVETHFKSWVENQKGSIAIQESALIFENKKQKEYDIIITVTAPVQERIQRLANRDNFSKDQIIGRMKHQMDDEFKIKNSNYVIHNVDLENTKLKVNQIFSEILNLP